MSDISICLTGKCISVKMVHEDHARLLRKAITTRGGLWADLGSGEGAFTLALRDLGGDDIKIYSVDQNEHSLSTQKKEFNTKFGKSDIIYLTADFTHPLDLPILDGILMANSLHYVQDHVAYLTHLKSYLKPEGKFVLVEYNVDSGNEWVPYPLSFTTFQKESEAAGFRDPVLLETIPSQFLEEIYSAETYC